MGSVAGVHADREGPGQRSAVGLEGGVGPVSLVFGFEDVDGEVQPEGCAVPFPAHGGDIHEGLVRVDIRGEVARGLDVVR